MASIELGPLSQHLDDDEIAVITQALAEADIGLALDEEADPRLLEADVDEDIFADFLDRLDAQGAACDIYVPGDFEDIIEAAGYTVGSSHALMMALDEMRDDLISEESEEAEDDDDDFEEFEDDEDENRYVSGNSSESVHIQESELRHLWKTLYKGARACARDSVCLFVHR